MSERLTREQAMSDLEQTLYRRSDIYDPGMPKLWQRSGMTSSLFRDAADEFVTAIPWLADFIAALPNEDEEA